MPDGSLWAFYTIPMPCAHLYERRIGMDRVVVVGWPQCGAGRIRPGVVSFTAFGNREPRDS